MNQGRTPRHLRDEECKPKPAAWSSLTNSESCSGGCDLGPVLTLDRTTPDVHNPRTVNGRIKHLNIDTLPFQPEKNSAALTRMAENVDIT